MVQNIGQLVTCHRLSIVGVFLTTLTTAATVVRKTPTMLGRSSQLVGRRVVHSFRLNCIKTLHSNQNNLEKTIDFKQRLSRLETTLGRAGKISVNDLNGCIDELAKCETNCFSLHIYLTLNPLTAKSIRPTTTQSSSDPKL